MKVIDSFRQKPASPSQADEPFAERLHITAFGVDQVRTNQASATPAINLSRAIVQVYGQNPQVMVDSPGGYQIAQHTFNTSAAVHALQEYRKVLRLDGLGTERTSQAEAYLAVAENELRKPTPDAGVLRPILNALREIALEAAGNAAWAGVAALLAHALTR